ncbi:acyl-CoA dehydrogenase domain protein (plasmid) [Azospirillum sp. B510]|uniref:acyl-CoA dehydrogenase family protein n=1 Tax=Azospirillum sp. (strain B510) TaxID=137722 RepID=UPI0001C4CC06|nr:acyl-CoA dehydrogenase family protein [Azospirillum sp. B510]BAI74860.1 acyl-CoA dehydrogenase domain protein [Azospirillum sp. B510]
MTSVFHYEDFDIPDECRALRDEVRAFLAEASASWSGWDTGHSWTRFDRAFSREVGRRRWIGMTWPRAYGGHERTVFERYVVIEEMLAAGAPVGSHWVGDRQSGPLLLRVGTEEQRRRFLPLIASGEASFCIGLSEPDAGSDLAGLRSRATRVDGGWRLNGRKIWTTYAQHCEFMIGLFRTGGSAETEKHRGLSQFLIDLRSSGIEVRPIRDMTGEFHFNEIVFDDVFVPSNQLVGTEGEGWGQANAELAFERSGPDRYLSSFPLLPLALDSVRATGGPDRLAARRIGETVADLAVLRTMSVSILGMLSAGKMPSQEAALTKQLGTTFEQRIPELLRELVEVGQVAIPGDRQGEMLNFLLQSVPTYSLRGGTREIMRGIIARGLGLR